jgi:hypothetical protein
MTRRRSTAGASKSAGLYQAPKIPTLTPVLAGLDPAIGYPQPIANGAIPISNQPMTMTGSGPVMTWLDRCVGSVNSKGGWYDTLSPPGRAPTRPIRSGTSLRQIADWLAGREQ